MTEMKTTGHARPSKFGKSVDEYLAAFYAVSKAQTTAEKIGLLQAKLGGTFNFYALGGEVTDDMKLTCLEYEYLERMGVIDVVLS
jgi:hypothetical protein